MFEYHGWVTIQSSAGDEDDEDVVGAHNTVSAVVRESGLGTGSVELRMVNGMSQLRVSGFANHRAGEGQEIIELFGRIGKLAPGSYGLLYFRDDEDRDGKANEFQVLVMKRGTVSQNSDPFLSPCVPEIEDAD
ncbi:Imm7 family immunity protein [Actinomadura opuntiae]|uniref:Imm7 family immunity protein n=1 Tax=Actinomadura sp. OS1-43 TaxID=604315 RepID=UPI00255A834F|nr:Imm7 family immunity protein [Actinomadura sp. OS1-43]MDL4820783.1 Imm7 family immunity protein [Actinomadura sp. OS1-43]